MGMFGRKWEIRRAVRPVVVGRQDGHVRAEVGNQAGGAASGGGHGDALGAHGGGHLDGGHAHNVVDDASTGSALGHGELGVNGHVLLSLDGYGGLHLDGLDRVLTGSGLAGQHNGPAADSPDSITASVPS